METLNTDEQIMRGYVFEKIFPVASGVAKTIRKTSHAARQRYLRGATQAGLFDHHYRQAPHAAYKK
jgi:hypothetical protein